MPTAPKKTPLHAWHAAHGGNMVDFGDYNMPLWYTAGTKTEHLTVLTHAGAFDTSHMALVMVAGPDAFDLLQRCFTRDLKACVGKDNRPLVPGRCVYGAYLNERGECIDDAIVYQIAPEDYMVVVNAGMGGEIARHLEAQREQRQVRLSDLTDKVGKMDLQGPQAPKIMATLLQDPGAVFDGMVYFSFKGHFAPDAPTATMVRLIDGTPLMLSRSGYTGEVGFEIFIEPVRLPTVWEMILQAGEAHGAKPCGLASRDSLRAGAMLPLSHQDIGRWPYVHHPWRVALPYRPDGTGFTKSFIGDAALLAVENPAYTYAFVGNDLRKVSAPEAVVREPGGARIGGVLTCATDMAIGRHADRIYSLTSPDTPEGFTPRGLSCGFVKVDRPLEPGQRLELDDTRRKITVTVVEDLRPDRTARRPLREFL